MQPSNPKLIEIFYKKAKVRWMEHIILKQK